MKLRSMLFVPGDSEHKFAKALGAGADALRIDGKTVDIPHLKAARKLLASI
jgi:citrate lyase subunit beta/citryl-CoA lyase